MDACIARGGISHVLSHARASLKNPSRPFTPRTNERPLFLGDDYRPGSRPSSSYSVAEQKELAAKTSNNCKVKSDGGPSGAALPPRPTAKAAHAKVQMSAPPKTRESARGKEGSIAKHQEPPRSQDHDSADETDPSGDESEETIAACKPPSSQDHFLETSVELPSCDALAKTLEYLTTQLDEMSRETPPRVTPQELAVLVRNLTEFTSSSAVFFTTGNSTSYSTSATGSAESRKVSSLRRRLFDSLVNLAVRPWHTSAKCVIATTPCMLELFQLGFGSSSNSAQEHEEDDAAAKIISLGKVLFVLSKETQHDAEFCNVAYVESALSLVATTTHTRTKSISKRSACPMKTLIYIAGTLKNVSSGDDKMLKLLATNGAIASLSDSLAWRSSDVSERKEIAQFLIQATTILRNLSTSKAYLKQFNEAQVASRLCDMVESFLPHQELMVNVSRILGKLTLHEVPRSQINQRAERHLGNLLTLVDARRNPTLAFTGETLASQNHADAKVQDVLLVRIFFVLGNLCASNDRNRQFLGMEARAIPILLQSLSYYGQQYVQYHSTDEKDPKFSRESCADVLVKLVRLIANMAMNADVGVVLNSHSDELGVLLDVLETTQAGPCADDELMLNIVSCLTNLSYYATVTISQAAGATSRSFIETNRQAITAMLSQILWDPNEEAVLEATRAFGNLSRFKDVLHAMGDNKVLDGFVILLDHSNREIVYTVCGVLMNAALDERARAMLLDVRQVHSGVGDAVVIDARALLANILECAAVDDLEMSCIAAKVLYNLLLAKRDEGRGKFLGSEAGRSLQCTVSSILRKLAGGKDDDDDDDTLTTRRDLRGVLTQLQHNMAPRSE